ncbi:MAG: putative hydrolase [Moraxellaceae bacterium]|jgi:pimeloyl-ACP methyl ester carboxylesterase|nr:putative hydrolase [Moraxellaceae bacterium]
MARQLKPFEQLPFAEVPDAPRRPHPYFAAEQRQVTVRSAHFGTVKMHVSVYGEGPPLLLLHGLMTASYSFRYVLEPLARHFTLYIPDLLGGGRSDKPRTSYGPDDLARSVGELMRELGIWGAPAIGNSMGGYLLMRLALLEPTAMHRLVNLHSPGLPTARMYALAAVAAVPPAFDGVLAALVARNAERWVHQNVHYHDESLKSREEHREYAGALTSEGGVNGLARHLADTLAVSEMRRFEQKLKTLDRFPVPLLLVYARQDKMVPPVVGERLARLVPDARIEWLEEASHFAHVDAPDAFLRAALPFLTTH